MAGPREKLSATQVRDASLEDWRQILGRLKARYRTGDFRTGLALVNMIGAAAEAAHHHPDIQLTYSDVIVTLVSHDVGGITSRDIELARQISIEAAELGIRCDVGGDVWVAHDEAERRLQAVLDAGGRLVSDRAAPAYWVVEDADGNRSCICTPAGR